MNIVTVADIDQGEIELQELPLDAVLLPNQGKGALWEGLGADRLNVAIERGWFTWPQRVDQVWMQGGVLVAGYPHPSVGIVDQDAIDYRARYWPLDRRQTYIPGICCFAINATPGARITGRLLVEIQ